MEEEVVIRWNSFPQNSEGPKQKNPLKELSQILHLQRSIASEIQTEM